jgi:hypothetical protein
MKTKVLKSCSFPLLINLFISFQMISSGQSIKLEITKSTSQLLNLNVKIPETKVSEEIQKGGKTYTQLNITGKSMWSDIGKPDVPVISEWILLPNDSLPEIEIIPGAPKILRDITLVPVQEPLVDCECKQEPEFVIDNVIYSTDADYPGTFTEIEPVKNKRGYKLTVLCIYPYQYNPVKKTLKVYPDLKVNLSFKGKPKSIPERLYSKTTEELVKAMVINAEQMIKALVPAEIQKSSQLNTRLKSSGPTGGEYLIITHDDFESAANTLKDWKNSLGISTAVVTTSAINSSFDSFNDYQKRTAIEDYIDNAYDTWNPCPEYLLLLGDAEFIPPWYASLDSIWDETDSEYCSGDDFPTDLNYTDIDDPIDYEADIPGYGRLPVDTEYEANTIVSRIIDYESNDKGDEFYSFKMLINFIQLPMVKHHADMQKLAKI